MVLSCRPCASSAHEWYAEGDVPPKLWAQPFFTSYSKYSSFLIHTAGTPRSYYEQVSFLLRACLVIAFK